MPHGFDNTWDIVKDSGLASSNFFFSFSVYFVKYFNIVVLLFQPVFVRT